MPSLCIFRRFYNIAIKFSNSSSTWTMYENHTTSIKLLNICCSFKIKVLIPELLCRHAAYISIGIYSDLQCIIHFPLKLLFLIPKNYVGVAVGTLMPVPAVKQRSIPTEAFRLPNFVNFAGPRSFHTKH